MKSILTFALLLLLFSASGNSQSLKFRGPDPKKAITQYTHEVWQTDHGLPQGSVNSIQQTKDGFLWLATQEGLVRFDGVQFTVFDKSNTPQIKSNHIVALAVDRKGVLWIATLSEGVVTYRNGKFESLDSISYLAGTQIQYLYSDFKNVIWVCTRDSGVVKIDSQSVTRYSMQDGLLSNNTWEVAVDMNMRVWIGMDIGLSIILPDTIISFSKADGLASKEVYALHPAHSGEMWIGGRDGLQKFALQNNRLTSSIHLTIKEGLPGNGVYQIITDQQGNMWLAGNKGLTRYYKGQISTFTDKDGLSERLVNTVFVDREGNLWIGTDGGGLNVLKDGIFTSYSIKEGMPHNNTWTVFEDNEKNIWVGTDEGLVLFDSTSKIKKIFNKKDGLSHALIWSIAQDANHAVWVGTINGLNKIVKQKIVELPSHLKLDDHAVNSLYPDREGALWVGTAGNGLFKIVGDKIITIGSEQGVSNKFINVITGDRNGNIVIGTDGDGLLFLRNDTVVQRYTTEEGLPANFIHSLYVDSSNAIWIGTLGNGLSVFNGTAFHNFSTKNGMFDDVVFQILEDDFGRMWFSCNKGIFQVERRQFSDVMNGTSAHIVYTAYGKENGMSSSECNGGTSPAGWKTADGNLWFPTSRGVTTVNPKNISINTQPPLVVVEDMIIDNESIDKTTAAIIPPGKQRYEFRFTGLSFDGPKKVRFKVMLEGYDKEWDDIKYRRAAYYSYLPPGEYTFRVIAANSDGVWNMDGASMPFIVQAHFYETKIFYFSVVVILVLVTYGSFRWRIRNIRARQAELERLVEERTKNLTEANNAKSQLLSFVAHDLKTPVITINSIAQEIKTFEIDRHFRGYLDLVELNSKRIVTLISEILNITAIETGKFQFKLEPINMADVAGLVVDGYQIQAQRKDQLLQYSVNEHDRCTVMADSSKLQEAMENLVNNAIKYSPRGSMIQVNVVRNNGSVRFSVNDQGPGINEQDKLKLFKKFTVLSAKPTGGEIATGLGLAIVKEIIEAHKGKIFVESEPPNGTTFTIELNHFESQGEAQ